MKDPGLSWTEFIGILSIYNAEKTVIIGMAMKNIKRYEEREMKMREKIEMEMREKVRKRIEKDGHA